MAAQGFVPHHALVSAADARPSRWMLVLHGILGSGANFRTFAQRLAAARPAWGFVLVDLRAHGQSIGAPPPSTVGAAAADLVRLEERLGLPVGAVAGHSFGGKVALAYLEERAPRQPLEHAFLLDSMPGARPDGLAAGDVAAVLRMLESLPETLPSRERFVELVTAQGFSRAIADWLAMNVRRAGSAGEGVRFRLDLPTIRALLEDYFARDLWPVLEEARGASAFHVVLGGRSRAYSDADRARLEAIAARSPAVTVHVLEGAGHWIHADDPDGLLAVMSGGLS